jgi:hypothetical protein
MDVDRMDVHWMDNLGDADQAFFFAIYMQVVLDTPTLLVVEHYVIW